MSAEVGSDRNVGIFRYEDFASDNARFLSLLFDFLNVEIPNQVLTMLCERHSFAMRSGGRAQGAENKCYQNI